MQKQGSGLAIALGVLLASACANRPELASGAAKKGAVVFPLPQGAPIREGVRAQVLLTPEKTGVPEVGLALLEIDLAREVQFHRHAGSETLFFLEGDGELLGHNMTTVSAREGVWIPPGVVHGFRATANARVLALYTPAGPERRYAGGEDPGTTAGGSDAVEDTRAAFHVFRPATAEPRKLANGSGVVRIALEEEKANGTPVSCSLLELEPGASVPEHVHAGSAEILYIFEGDGTLRIDGRDETVHAPAAVLVPANVKHAFTVTSATPLRAVQWYSPPGPEQRFKAAK